jgi:GntR family transcriptional regulator
LYRQIMDSIKSLIASGALKPGDQLPSIRELAAQLRINPASALKAYNELRHAGLIVLTQGSGTFVSGTPGVVKRNREELLAKELKGTLAKAKGLGFSDAEILEKMKRLLGASE